MSRRYRIRSIRARRSYTLSEIAILLAAHVQTVRGWVKAGLPALEGSRPALIMGYELIKFLGAKQEKRRVPLAEGEM
jgi:hypothetical protein